SNQLAGPSVSPSSNAPATLTAETALPSAPKNFPKWNPLWWFGNVDDPVPPDWYRPGEPHRTGKWYWRNSLHNFTFYVIGIADKQFVRVGRAAETNFNPGGGWNWAVCKYKGLRLPFASYQKGKFMCYIGWRERGNFGAKLNW